MIWLNKMDAQKWQKLTGAQQLANIGSELNRAFSWRQKEDKKNEEAAVWRALELLDLTLADEKWQGRTKELRRLREVFCDMFLGENEYNIKPEVLEDYFLPFALNVRSWFYLYDKIKNNFKI